MCYNNVEISEMTLDDLNIIQTSLFTEFNDFWNIKTFTSELNCENSFYIKATINNNIVGFGGIKVILDEADVMNIVTKKANRNSGIGNTILKNLIYIAQNKGVKKITLEVNENNLPAISLYKKFGFNQIAIRDNYYNNADKAIIMQIQF